MAYGEAVPNIFAYTGDIDAQPLDDRREDLEEVVDVRLGREAAERQAQQPCAISGGQPMESSTWLGSSEPDEHAEPVETAMPLLSSCSSIASPSTPLMSSDAMLGRRAPSRRRGLGVLEHGRHAVDEAVAQRRPGARLVGLLREHDLERRREADGAGHVLRAGALLGLLAAARAWG